MNYTLGDARKEAVRQTERFLESQQALSTAADQRALAFCSAVIVISALLFGNLSNSTHFVIDSIVLGLFILSSVLAALSAKPTRFYGSGGRFVGIEPYLNEHYCGLLLDEISKRNDDHINMNDKAIRRSAWTFRIALIIGFAGVLLMFAVETGITSIICGYIK